MLTPRREDSIHKAWLLRLLTAICENKVLSSRLGFKGGTCAALRGFLDRFSVDLDFDILTVEKEIPVVGKALEAVFAELGLEIKDKSGKVPQYFLKYPVGGLTGRNTIKVDVAFPVPGANKYEMVRLTEIDRVVKCQTIETMFANKLVALIARYERTGKIAGRDIFDMHHFFMRGYAYDAGVIVELRGISVVEFFVELVEFVEKHVTSTLIDQDLNYLLPEREFQKVRKVLKVETLVFLRDEVRRVGADFKLF